MRILGGREMLKVEKTSLLYQFWRNREKCRELLSNPTQENVTNIIKRDIEIWEGEIHNLDFLIWYGTNGAMGIVFPNPDDEDYDLDDLDATDINIVGDASPWETLWIVFDKDEWPIVDRECGIGITEHLEKTWSRWENEFEGNKHPDWVNEYLYQKDVIDGHEDIICANIEVTLK